MAISENRNKISDGEKIEKVLALIAGMTAKTQGMLTIEKLLQDNL
jgi:hypothetical protein